MYETKQHDYSPVPDTIDLKEVCELLEEDGIHALKRLLLEYFKTEELTMSEIFCSKFQLLASA